MLVAAGRAGDQFVIAMHTTMLAGVCYVRGDWNRGRDLAGRALECFAAGSSPVAVRWAGVLAPIMIWHGAWDQARAYLEGSLQAARSVQLVSIEWTALTPAASVRRSRTLRSATTRPAGHCEPSWAAQEAPSKQ